MTTTKWIGWLILTVGAAALLSYAVTAEWNWIIFSQWVAGILGARLVWLSVFGGNLGR